MATISKFYLHAAVTGNSNPPSQAQVEAPIGGFVARSAQWGTCRSANDAIGTSNPDITSTANSGADTDSQVVIGHVYFASAPLASQTVSFGTWTFSYARSESNLAHNQSVRCRVSVWNPSTGAFGDTMGTFIGTEPTSAGVVQAQSVTFSGGGNISAGSYLMFAVFSQYTQSMASSYSDTFEYDGTTEASITTCATFVTPPAAITLAAADAIRRPYRQSNQVAIMRPSLR